MPLAFRILEIASDTRLLRAFRDGGLNPDHITGLVETAELWHVDLDKEALEYALGMQLRNTGIHSRFIDGVVLEDGFQLDEAVAPILAAAAYVRRTGFRFA